MRDHELTARDSIEGPGAGRDEGLSLARVDEVALERLVESGFAGDAESSGGEASGRIARLLALLNSPVPAADSILAAATIARVRRLTALVDPSGPVLSEKDSAAVDVALEDGRDGLGGGVDERTLRHAALASLLASAPEVGPSSTLITDTLNRVEAAARASEHRRSLTAARRAAVEQSQRHVGRFRLGDLVSVAAVALLGFSVLMPMMQSLRGSARQAACRSNLAAAGLAFSQYGGDFRESLPLASESRAGQPWWEVGISPERSNSANLFTLVRGRYATVETLACAGNADACREAASGAKDWSDLRSISYSYANMFTTHRPTWAGDNRVVVVVDKSPVVLRARMNMTINPFENSPNHGGHGQNILYNDGSVEFATDPIQKDGDMLWLPEPLEFLVRHALDPTCAKPLKGTESQQRADDAFLVP